MLLHELSFINKNEATYQEDMSFEWFFNITISLYVIKDVLLGEKKEINQIFVRRIFSHFLTLPFQSYFISILILAM